jgi:xyloglucan-specific exo-beta-1,4-glucanase
MRNSSGNPVGTATFTQAPLGAGGFCTGVKVNASGAAVHSTDVFNGYFRDAGSTTWRQLFTSTSLPTASITRLNAGTNNAYVDNAAAGCYAAAIAPSNDSVIWSTINAELYRSTDKGVNWTFIGGPYTMLSNTKEPRLWQNKLVVDPQNPAVAMLGPQEGKIIVVTDGATPQVLTVAAGTTYGTKQDNVTACPSPHLVAVDPSSTVTGGIKQKWAYSVNGTGIYQSTTGPTGTYSLLSGSPTQTSCLFYDAAGNLWATNIGESSGGNIYKKAPAGSFAKVTSPDMEAHTVAVDPNNTNSVVAMDRNGATMSSTTGGSTWLGNDKFQTTYPGSFGISKTASQIRWLGGYGGSQFFPSQLNFHPTNGKLYCAEGTGIVVCTPPTTFSANGFAWTDDSLGNEMLLSRHVLTLPGGRKPIFSVCDKGMFRIADETRWTNINKFPDPSCGFGHGWHCDYVPGNPDRLLGTCAYNTNAYGYSTDAGITWQAFTGTHPAGTVVGGCIVGSTANDLYWFPRNNARAAESHDGGATWAYSTFPAGVPTSGTTGWGNSLWDMRITACSDKVTGDVYAVNYVSQCLYKRAAGSGSWVQVSTKFWTGTPSGNSLLISVPGNAGHLLFVGGYDGLGPLYRSTDGGVTWGSIPNMTNVGVAGWGAAAPGKTGYSLYAQGTVGGVAGLYRTDDYGATWVLLGTYPNGSLDALAFIAGDHLIHGKIYVGMANTGGLIGSYSSKASAT